MLTDREIADLHAELKGYKELVNEMASANPGTTVFMVFENSEHVIKIFGPSPEREEAFAKTVAQYYKLQDAVYDHLVSEEEKKKQCLL